MKRIVKYELFYSKFIYQSGLRRHLIQNRLIMNEIFPNTVKSQFQLASRGQHLGSLFFQTLIWVNVVKERLCFLIAFIIKSPQYQLKCIRRAMPDIGQQKNKKKTTLAAMVFVCFREST